MSIQDATFIVQRGGQQFSCLGKDLKDKLLDDDLLIAQDPDGNKVSVKKADFSSSGIDYSNEPWHPDNLSGSKWLRIHIKNVTLSTLNVRVNSGTNSGIYRLSDGAKVSSPLPFDDGEEYIVLGYDTFANLNQDAGIQLKSHYANWELGELTDVSNITNGWQMFKGATNFNTPMPGKYFHTPNMKNMTQFMADCYSFNQDLSDWCLSNSPGLNDTWRGTALESNYDLQPNYGECNVEQEPLPSTDAPADDCLFVVTDGDNGHKSVTGAQVKELFIPLRPWQEVDLASLPWHGVVHIKNLSKDMSLSKKTDERLWTMDDNEIILRPLENIWELKAGTEYVMLAQIALRFKTIYDANWDFGEWTDTSRCQSFQEFCANCDRFNGDISHIRTDSAKSTERMFASCQQLRANIPDYNMSNVENAANMFIGCSHVNYDSPVPRWDLSKLNKQGAMNMFKNCLNLDADFSHWCVPNIDSLPDGMFYMTKIENQTDKHPVWGTCP